MNPDTSPIMYEDDDETGEHHNSVYAYFGAAIYHAQCLEHGLVIALVYLDLIPNHHRQVRSVEEWQKCLDGFMDRKFESTLGQLIKELSRIATIPTDLTSRLATALRLRNWLAHDFFRERALEWISREGRDRMISELEECRTTFLGADRLLDATFKPVRERFGFTDERLQRAYEEMMSEARSNGGGINKSKVVPATEGGT